MEVTRPTNFVRAFKSMAGSDLIGAEALRARVWSDGLGQITTVPAGGESVAASASELDRGLSPSRFVDEATENLAILGANFEDIQRTRKMVTQRGDVSIGADMMVIEERLSRALGKALKAHPLWPWLAPLKGLHGPITARFLGLIGDPRRFPGQRCSEGHYLPPILELGQPCPVAPAGEDDVAASCPGIMREPRTGSGVRSLWHYCGVHVVDGRAPRRRKGVRSDWSPDAKTLLLQPQGLAEQIVRHRTPKYRDIYDERKERLSLRAAASGEIDKEDGSQGFGAVADSSHAIVDGGGLRPISVTTEGGHELDDVTDRDGTNGAEQAENARVVEVMRGLLRPFQIDAIARKVAVKAFIGDMLVEWKGLMDSASNSVQASKVTVTEGETA